MRNYENNPTHNCNKNKKIPKKKFNKRWHMTIMYKQNYKTLSKDIKEGPKKNVETILHFPQYS